MTDMSPAEFKKIVDGVAANRSRITKLAVGGFSVSMTVLSRSRKKGWSAWCTFDPATGNYVSHSAYPQSVELGGFLREISEQLQAR